MAETGGGVASAGGEAGPADDEKAAEQEHIAQAVALMAAQPVDVAALRRFVAHRGTRFDAVREYAWPLVLCSCPTDVPESGVEASAEPDHDHVDIVAKDVARSQWKLDACRHSYTPEDLARHRAELGALVNSVLARNRHLQYFQGYHDVATVLVLAVRDGAKVESALERVSNTYFRECMRPGLEQVMQLLSLLFPLLGRFDRRLEAFLHRCDLAPYFCLSWVLTWFSHDIPNMVIIARLWDAFLSSHPMLPLYVSAYIVQVHKAEVLQLNCDFSTVHSYLSKLPAYVTEENVEQVLCEARAAMVAHPPDELALDSPSYDRTLLFSSHPIVPLDRCLALEHVLRADERADATAALSGTTESTDVGGSGAAAAAPHDDCGGAAAELEECHEGGRLHKACLVGVASLAALLALLL